MAENLRVTHYNDDSEITHITNNEDWGSYDEGQYGVYDNDPSNADIYGNLYNFAVVVDDRGVCPEGWHMPSDEEIIELEMELGMSEEEANSTGWRGTDEGSQLAGNSGLWNDGNLENNSEFGTSGFNVLPTGFRVANTGNYDMMGLNGYFWSSSENTWNLAWVRYLRFTYSVVDRSFNYNKQWGLSIRCLQDDTSTGCTDSEACNYDETATADDGSCEYEFDCSGTCGGDLEPDCCGACGGDNSQCSNCCGIPFNDDCTSDCYEDYNTGECCIITDVDECGVCNGDGPQEHHNCDGNCLVEFDCAGNCCVLGEEGCYWQETGPCGEEGPSNGMDSCGVCGGDNTSCADCAGVPCSNAYVDYCGVCDDDPSNDCVQDCAGTWGGDAIIDECGVCGGDNACLCTDPFISIDGHCLHGDDLAVLQGFIDNSLNSGFVMEGCDPNDPWCSSPNLYMDQSDNWHDVIIDGVSYQFSNDNGLVEPLELGLQDWENGRLTSLMCGAYIYCQLSGQIPGNISDLTEIEVLRLEVNYFSGEIPESVCELENINFSDDLAFNFSYNMLCPPYPDCVEEGAVQYMDISECEPECDLGDVNCDGQINVIDIVLTVGLILDDSYDAVGDVNEDGLLNVIDVVMLVNWVLNGMPEADSDGDGVLDDDDSDPNNPYQCSDVDGDACEDCSTGTFNPSDDGWDYDEDGSCDAGDNDDDNDGAADPADSDDNNEYVCSDVDGDNCDDCSSGTFDPTNDGPDMNGNGICDEGEANNDSDGDGVIDDEDSDPYNPYQCSDLDGDTCDDCSEGYFNPFDDGYDYDGDGQCDDGDCDDDNDGCQECWDYCP